MHAVHLPDLPEPGDVAVVVGATGRVVPGYIDLTDEAGIVAAAAQARALGTVRLVIVASGMLHDEAARPERTWAELRPEALMKLFAVNAIGPALVAKYFLPLLARQGRSVFASISARVGSIEDNRLTPADSGAVFARGGSRIPA